VARKGRARRGTRGRLDLSHASMCGALGPPIKKRILARHLTCDFAILSHLCGEVGAGCGWWLRKRCGGEEGMGWCCSCQLSMTLMQLTVDARCVCGAASHVVTALDGSSALLRFQGASGEQ